MTANYKKLYEQALCYAKRRFFRSEDAEDFAGFVMVKKVEGSRASFGQIYVDHMRESFGRSGQKQALASAHTLPSGEGEDKNPDAATTHQDLQLDLRLLLCLAGSQRIAAVLYFMWGFSQAEIATVIGVSESRVAQILPLAIEAVRAMARADGEPALPPKPKKRGKKREKRADNIVRAESVTPLIHAGMSRIERLEYSLKMKRDRT